MPWEIRQGTSQCAGYGVFKEGTNELEGCHSSRGAAERQMAALYASEPEASVKNKSIWSGAFTDVSLMFSKKDYSTEERRRMASRGQAMPDGSFPIANRADLRNAIQSVGRASNYEAARRHIIRRARALGATEMLPEDWQ